MTWPQKSRSIGVDRALHAWAAFDKARHAEPACDDATLRAVHGEAVAAAVALLDPTAVDEIDDATTACCVAEAALGVARLSDVVGSAEQVIDTIGSRTLHGLIPDAKGDDASRCIEAVAALGGLSDDDLARIRRRAEHDFEDLDHAVAVVGAIRDIAGVGAKASDLNASLADLFAKVYAVTPPPGRVGAIVTRSQLIFCIHAHPDPSKPDPLGPVLDRGKDFETRYFGHFPAFGFVDPAEVDATFAEALADRLNESDTAAREAIASVTTLMRAEDVDKYIVHDAWGHAYQATLLRFDDAYVELAAFEDAATALADRPLDAAATDAEVETHVADSIAHRLHIAFAAMIAELLADACEHKALADDPALHPLMPSSSRFKDLPTKLDLSLDDLRLYFRLATRGVARLAEPAERDRYRDLLITRGTAAPQAARLAAATAAAVDRLLADVFALHGRAEDIAAAHAPAYQRLGLNTLALHAQMLAYYPAMADLDLAPLGLRGGRDLFLLAVVAFYLDDPATNLWRLDEFVALRLVPFLRRLAEQPPGS
ncbi:MAG: hypothetical protein AAF078_05225 [Planctomycetota bacterium]